MPLTSQQLTTLKANIVANSTPISVNGGAPVAINALPDGPEENFAIAAWYNQQAAPNFFVFRTSVDVNSVMSNGFDWTRVDNATVGKARIWEWMTRLGSINPAKANIIAGINEAWGGGANDAHRLAIFGHCQKLATNVEKLFAVGGAGTTISNAGVGPATPVVASVTPDDVSAARNSP